MDKWLGSIGLKGRALQLATAACDDNLVEDISILQALADDEKQFNLCFPQAVVRSVILKALAVETTEEDVSTVESSTPDRDLELPRGKMCVR